MSMCKTQTRALSSAPLVKPVSPLKKSLDFISFDSSAELFCNPKLDSLLSVSSCPWLTQGTVMTITVPEITTQPDYENGSKSDTLTSEETEQAPCHLHVKKPTDTDSRITTPDKKLPDKIVRFSWDSSQEDIGESEDDTASETSSVSSTTSLGSQSSQKSLPKDNRGIKWISADGEYDLDRAKTCKLSFMQDYMSQNAAENLASEISEAVSKLEDFDLVNSKRYKVNLSHSNVTTREEVSAPGKKKKKKVSELHVDLDDDLELCKLVKDCQDKTSKALGEVFGLNVEFDKTTIQRFDSTSHNIPYENEDPDGQGGPFSPTVAILTIGSDQGRPMFLRTAAGSVRTHKIVLKSGSMCILSGRAEVRYKRSIPKDYGEEGEQYFITMVEKRPDDSILEVLKNIPIPTTGAPKESPTPDSFPAVVIAETVNLETSASTEVNEDRLASNDNTDSSPVLNTPPTVIRRGSMIFENGKPLFKDLPQYEPGGGLLLTETVGAAVDRMDDKAVTAELMRSGCPIEGSLEDKRRRLQNKICLSLGEMSMTAANMNMKNSINILRNASPECDTTSRSLLHGELENLNETFSNSQKCIEDTLKMVVDNIVEMKSEISSVKRASLNAASDTINSNAADLIREEEEHVGKSLRETGVHIRALSNEVNLCSERIGDLLESLDSIKQDLRRTSEEMTDMRENATDILRRSVDDMQNYCTSVFADESRVQIKKIYDIVVEAYETLPEDHDNQQGENGASDRFRDIEEEGANEEDESEEVDDENEMGETSTGDRNDETPAEDEREQIRPSAKFNFPTGLSPSLQRVVKSNQKIEVLLITDSIMRHISEDDMNFGAKYRVNFTRVDRTSTKALAQRKLLEMISTKKPHLIYVHLGINDVQEGSDPMEAVRNLENFDKRLKEISPSTHLILSSPLLNGKSYHTRSIYTIRRSLMLYLHKQEFRSDYRQSRLSVQPNAHFLIDPSLEQRRQNPRYFLNNDPLHLSPLGRRAIISTMRDTLNSIFKQKEEEH